VNEIYEGRSRLFDSAPYRFLTALQVTRRGLNSHESSPRIVSQRETTGTHDEAKPPWVHDTVPSLWPRI
jgi:hypothetical protein